MARKGSVLTLSFTVNDENELPSVDPPPGWTIRIGPAGSVLPVITSGVQSGARRSYSYRWTVPLDASFTTLGYFINVSDAAGNWRTASSPNIMTIGKLNLSQCWCTLIAMAIR